MDDKNAWKSLHMASVADLMDGRFLHTLICLALEQASKGLEGMLYKEFRISLFSSQGIYLRDNGHWTF